MKKLLTYLLCITLLVTSTVPVFAAEPQFELESTSVIVRDAYNGTILFEENSHEQMPPASMTKLMSALLVIEDIESGFASLEDVIYASSNASSTRGSRIYLMTNERMTLDDLLYAMLLASANDACVAVAEELYGSVETFVQRMNQRAQELGMTNTRFMNPNGLPDDNHYSTAYDLSILAMEAVKHPLLLHYTSTKDYVLRADTKPYSISSTNMLLDDYPGLDGLKTGWIGPSSGYCFASTALQDGMRLVSVVQGAQKTNGNFRDTRKLLDYHFETYQNVPIFNKEQTIEELKLKKGMTRRIAVGANQDITQVIEQSQTTEFSYSLELNEKLKAPIDYHQNLGKINVIHEGETIASYDLVALETVDKCNLFPWNKIKWNNLFNK